MSEELKKKQEQPEDQQDRQAQEVQQQAIFGETVARTVKFNTFDKELMISFMDFEGQQEIKTCQGDIYKIVNALMDYSRLLETAAQEWDISSYHKAVYEVQAEELRKIANKYSLGIGYNYYEALEKCKKHMERQQQKGRSADDVGEEALALTLRQGQRKQAQKEQQAQGKQG